MGRGALTVCAGTVTLCLTAAPSAARAWGTREHQEIGAAAYLQACADVAPRAAAAGNADGARARFEIACGHNAAILARIYGDATAVAGDYMAHPSELTSAAGAWRFSSKKHYWLLALENSAHFNPMATQSWREYHARALDHALAAAASDGLSLVEKWGLSIRENAFADHFLHDSFASGHMGFNRRASSAAAAKRFHDHWNAIGRVVRDFDGNTWKAHGDGWLDREVNEDGRRRVLLAATGSVRDLLLTFVSGRRHPQESIGVWRSLPFTMEAPELLVDSEALVLGRSTGRDATPVPLVSVLHPARKDTVAHAKVWWLAPFSDGGVTTAATADVELAVPILPLQASLGAGGALHEPGGTHRLVVDAGLLIPLGLSADGFVGHEIEAGASTFLGRGAMTVAHIDYEANLELGTWLVTAHVGLAEFVPAWKIGWRAGLGLGFVFSAAGGGAI